MQEPHPECWDYWEDGAHEPPFNMAADEALLLTAARRGRPLLRRYAWDRPAVSLGYVQRWEAAPAGFAAVRRPTGGGIVYHDFDFTYSIAFPAGHWLTGLDRITSYDWINRSVQHGLCGLGLAVELAQVEIPHSVERATMVCFTNPTRYDLLLDGRKIAGSAQRRTADGLLHQGSLHFNGPLPFPRDEIARALEGGFADVMRISLARGFRPDAELEARIAQLVQEKYATEAWNHLR